MSSKYDYNYIILGGHPASYSLALALAKSGKRLAIAEAPTAGYTDFSTYDIARNLSLDFSHHYYNILQEPAVHGQPLHYNLPTLVAHQDRVFTATRESHIKSLTEKGVELLNGPAHFLSDHSVAIGSSEYSADNFIIATKRKLKTTEISGLDHVNYLTPDTAFRIRRIPECALVVGGGPTGVEIACFYAELGAKVIIMERMSRLLPKEDKEISDTIKRHFTEDLDITILDNSRLTAVSSDEASKIAIFTNKAQEKMVRVDCIVLATGSTPDVESLGLDNAGVKYKRAGIIADKYLTSSARNIYCLGSSVDTEENFSPERTLEEAHVLASNLAGKLKTSPRYSSIARVIRTNPEIAIVGLNERGLLARDLKAKHTCLNLSTLPRLHTTGFAKLLTDHTGHLLGASIISPSASAFSYTFSLAISRHLSSIENIL